MNKPVAWMLNGKLHEFDPSDWAKEEYPDDDVIPLYTHPVKELTDEEIMDVWCSTNDYDSQSEEALNFAKAILRKAQEK